MTPGGLVLATVIQLGTFLAPLVLARAGLISGEVAGLVDRPWQLDSQRGADLG